MRYHAAPQALTTLTHPTLQVAAIEQAEKDKMRAKVQRTIDHGINCFINRQLIYNFREELFANQGVMAIEHADFDGIDWLALSDRRGDCFNV